MRCTIFWGLLKMYILGEWSGGVMMGGDQRSFSKKDIYLKPGLVDQKTCGSLYF